MEHFIDPYDLITSVDPETGLATSKLPHYFNISAAPLHKAHDQAKHTAESCAAHILRKASDHLSQRAKEYDQFAGERSMAKTVEMFNTLTGRHLTEVEGWKFMAILKMVRSCQGAHKLDNYEDGAAYFALAAEAVEQGSK